MSCATVQKSLSAFLDDEIHGAERRRLAQHLEACRECSDYSRELRSVRDLVREMPRLPSPARLRTELQVIASRARSPQSWRDRAALTLHDIMRPLAVPATGGLFCAILLFGILGDGLGYASSPRNDIPMGLFTQVTIAEPPPFACSGHDVVVELTIDQYGKVADYSMPKGHLSRAEMREMGNLILFTSFNPATAYGLPTSSRVLVSFRHINVRG